MLVVQIRLLAGRYVATQFDNRGKAEWPPHPARLFAAAVAAWADVDDRDAAEREALQWWESLGPPTIACSLPRETATRSVVTHYVPVNDVSGVLSRDASTAYSDLIRAIDLERTSAGNGIQPLDSRAQRRALTAIRSAQAKTLNYARSGRAPHTALGILPEHRTRQARTFPSTTPADEVVTFTWSDAEGKPAQIEALDRVLGRIARLGHSSSPVDVAVVEQPSREPAFEPVERGQFSLRTPVPGQLEALIAAYADHRGTELRTLATGTTDYRQHRPAMIAAHSDFDDESWLVFDLHPRGSLLNALALTRALRGALLSNATDPSLPVLSGHEPGQDGLTRPLLHPHAAYVALPFVGSKHADGSIHAVAVVRPRGATSDDRAAVAEAVGRWQEGAARLLCGRAGGYDARQLRRSGQGSRTAREATWVGPATRWSSVTPVVLDRHPKGLHHVESARRERAEVHVRRTLADACTNIGLPEPTSVAIRFDSPIRGTKPVRAFPPYAVGQGSRRRVLQLVHADFTFAEPVTGPIILGAGRYFGYGLCWPHPSGVSS